jgi:hypothetical protein
MGEGSAAGLEGGDLDLNTLDNMELERESGLLFQVPGFCVAGFQGSVEDQVPAWIGVTWT